jgi:hypothetical protein
MGLSKKTSGKDKKQSFHKKKEFVLNKKSGTLRESLLEVLKSIEERSSIKNTNLFDENIK